LLASEAAISCGTVVSSSAGGGGGGGELFVLLSLFRAFFRRRRQNSIRPRMAIKPTRPPTVPPAIAATFVFLESPGERDSVVVGEGTGRVAALAEKLGLRV
jgi:MYXO-CTERM domain-containing protein